MAKREIFQFAAQFTHAEPVRNRREDVHRLFGDAFSLLRAEILQRAHVVQAVGKFDQHDAHVVDHRQQHLAHVLGLLLFARDVADLRDLGEAIDQVGDLFAEVFADRFEIDERVFDDVVQQTGGDGDFVELHVGENVGDFERMDEIRFAGGALLSFVLARRKEIGAPQQIEVRLRVVAARPSRQCLRCESSEFVKLSVVDSELNRLSAIITKR